MPAPTATYRLQLHPGFTLDDAIAVLPHLEQLGVSHVYLSPVLAAVPGSMHGYDVVDHEHVSDHLGGDPAWARFTEAARRHRLGVVVDIVPNHASIEGEHNRRWLDVLESGPSSESADWFDIDWVGREEHHRGHVVLPVLGDLYGELLDAGELGVAREGTRFVSSCPGHRFPLAPRSLPLLLEPVVERVRPGRTDDADALQLVADSLRALAPAHTARERRRRSGHVRVLYRLLGDLLAEPALAAEVDAELAHVNAEPAAVHAVLEEQHYRLAYWRAAAKELDYRRFFDITTLAAIRVEDEQVFDAVHQRVIGWLSSGEVDGVRVDHPDGLADPRGYFRRLRAAVPDAWIVAEKILEGDEQLPDDWPVDGTTGYEAMRLLTGALTDPDGLDALAEVEAAAHHLCGTEPPDPAVVVVEAKRAAVTELLAADLERVTDLAVRITERRPRHRDHPRSDLRRAIAGLAVGLAVYRTYAVPGESAVAPADEQRIRAAAAWAVADDDTIDARLVDFLADLLTLRAVDPAEDTHADEWQFVVRFQQLSGPATAKGLEDTAWYRLGRYVAANEVGGDPLHPAVSLDELHQACMRRQERWPWSMTTLSTHDTKRSADVRARLAVLSEPGAGWPALAARWLPRLLDRWPTGVDPHATTLLVTLQTIVGAWPISVERLRAYLRKASREAKERTSWTRPDAGFEQAIDAIAGIVDDPACMAELAEDIDDIVAWGRRNALVQSAVHLMQPGVPDTYQGTEGEDLSLVDPDNRRPVDFQRLTEARRGLAPTHPDADKVRMSGALLDLRRRRPELFGGGDDGAHVPLPASGPDADRIIAFARGRGACLVGTRFPARGWIDPAATVVLPAGRWRPVWGGPPDVVVAGGADLAVRDLVGEQPLVVLEELV